MGEQSEVLIRIGGILDVTGEVVVMWILLAVAALVSFLVTRNLKERPGTFQNMIETGIESLDGFVSGVIGKRLSRKYFFFCSGVISRVIRLILSIASFGLMF